MNERMIGKHGDRVPATPTRKGRTDFLPRYASDMQRSPEEVARERDDRAWAARFPLAHRRQVETAARIEELELQRARAAFHQKYPGRPLPKELQDGVA